MWRATVAARCMSYLKKGSYHSNYLDSERQLNCLEQSLRKTDLGREPFDKACIGISRLSPEMAHL
jgi:hypothetical protein